MPCMYYKNERYTNTLTFTFFTLSVRATPSVCQHGLARRRVSPFPCKNGLVRKASKSITQLLRGQEMTAAVFSCLVSKQELCQLCHVFPNHFNTRRALGRAYAPPTKLFRRLAVNKTILKPRLAAEINTYTSDFPDVKLRVAWLIR